MTFGDLAILKSLGIVISICFLIGFLIAGLVKRFLGGSRLSWYTMAGGLSLAATLILMEHVLELMPVAGARTTAGMFTQALAGAMGGFVFAQLTKPKPTGNERGGHEDA